MKTKELITCLDSLDSEGIWLFTPAMLACAFPKEPQATLIHSLSRFVDLGLLTKVKKGLYANERARCAPVHRLEALVPYLRPGAINYLSQESRLADLGFISQMPLSHLTLMTTGRSQVFTTCYGSIEFTHTKRSPKDILSEVQLNAITGLLEASPRQALKDLNRANRNQGLVDRNTYTALVTSQTTAKER